MVIKNQKTIAYFGLIGARSVKTAKNSACKAERKYTLKISSVVQDALKPVINAVYNTYSLNG
jgi:hypothetical protein